MVVIVWGLCYREPMERLVFTMIDMMKSEDTSGKAYMTTIQCYANRRTCLPFKFLLVLFKSRCNKAQFDT